MQANSVRNNNIFNSFRNNIQNNIQSASRRLASGRRINSAADDAAGLAIAQRLEAQIRGLNQGTRNALDFDSALITAEGGLSTVTDSLIRIRELAIQAGSDVLNNSNRALLQAEIDQHLAQIDSTGRDLQFNTRPLLDGSFVNMNVQVGANAGQMIGTSIDEISAVALGIDNFSVMGGPQNIDLAAIDNAIGMVVSNRGSIGATQNRIEHIVNNNTTASINMSAARSRIEDADMALEMMRLHQARILEQMQIFNARNQQERTRANLRFVGIM